MTVSVDNPGSPPPAVILGLEHPRAVSTISALGATGVPVVGIDYRPSRRAHASRYLSRRHLVGPDANAALDFLRSMDNGGVLIPTSDEYLILLSQNHDELSRRFALTVPPWDVLEPLMDLRHCYEIGQACGLKTPRTFKPANREDLESIISNLDLEESRYLIRTPVGTVPADSRSGRFTQTAGREASVIEERCLEIHSRLGDFPLIVEVVPGEADQCLGVSMAVDDNHEPLFVHCIRRLTLHTYSREPGYRHPYELGANVFCETIHDDEVVEAATALVRRTKYTGPITVEFRRDPRDGSLFLIKADPRVVRATGLSCAINQDLPVAIYRIALGHSVNAAPDYADGVCWLWLTPYIKSLWVHRRNGPVLRKLLGLLKRAGKLRSMAYWGPRDPLPLIVDLAMGLRTVLSIAQHGLSRAR